MKKMICLWIRMGKKNIKKSFFFLIYVLKMEFLLFFLNEIF